MTGQAIFCSLGGMGDTKRLDVEVVAVGDPREEAMAILRHYHKLAREGRLTGIMVIAELAHGAYAVASVSGTDNLAERLGRLELLRDDLKDRAKESAIEPHPGILFAREGD